MASPVELHFADGTVLKEWESFTLRETFVDALGSFDFVARPTAQNLSFYRAALKKGELVSLVVAGVPQTVALIQSVTTTISTQGGTQFRIACKNPLITAVQGAVDPTTSVHSQADTPLLNILLGALGPYGFSSIVTDNTVNVDVVSGKALKGKRKAITDGGLKSSDVQAHDDERAYPFCARQYTRYGVCLRLDWNGQLMLSAPDYDQEPGYDLVQDSTGARKGDRFFGEITIEDSNDDQFSECTVTGNAPDNAGSTLTGTPIATVTAASINPTRPQYTSTSATYKPLKIRDKSARDVARCTSVAKLAMGLRAARAFVIKGTVDGFVSQSGRVWSVDTVAHVYIEAAAFEEDMWILSRSLIQDKQGGQRTELELLPLGALVLGDIPS